MDADRPRERSVARIWLAPVLLVTAAAMVLHRRFAGVGLVGWDTYPLIATSRIASWHDLLRVLSTSLMGRESGGIYYRPLPKLSLALDYALWGLDPKGYHVTDALLFVAAALALFWLASNLLGPRSYAGAIAALVFFLLHPVHATAMPAPSRRPDTMCLLFVCLCLASVARAAQAPRSKHFRGGAAAIAAAVALSSKETAFVLPPLAWLTAYCRTGARGVARRVAAATVLVLPIVAVTIVLIPIRVQILGGIVGARPIRQTDLLAAFADMAGRVVEGLLCGPAIVGAAETPIVLATLLVVAAAGTLLRAARAEPDATDRAAASTTVIASAWIVTLIATYTVGLILQPWYLLNVLAALSLLVGAGFSTLLDVARGGTRGSIAAVLGLVVLVVLVGRVAAYSPLIRSYDEWHRATAIEDAYLAPLKERLETADQGAVLHQPLPPMLLPRSDASPQLMGVALLAPYSVRAWVELELPQRRMRVEYGRYADDTADPDGVVLVLGRTQSRPSGHDPPQGR